MQGWKATTQHGVTETPFENGGGGSSILSLTKIDLK